MAMDGLQVRRVKVPNLRIALQFGDSPGGGNGFRDRETLGIPNVSQISQNVSARVNVRVHTRD